MMPILFALAAIAYALLRVAPHRAQFDALHAGAFGWSAAALGAGVAALLVCLARMWRRRRADAGQSAAGTWRMLLYSAVGYWAGYVMFAQPFFRLYFDLGVGLSATLFGLALLTGPRLPTTVLRIGDRCLLAACVLLLCCELGLRLVAAFSSSPLLSQPGREATARLGLLRDAAVGSTRFGFPFNRRGYYDEELADPGRHVAMIGDSFSVGMVPHALHFSTVAERGLDGARIDNIGLPSIGPHEYLTLLEQELAVRRPAVAVLNLFIGNDVTDARHGQPANRRLRLWFGRENVLWWQVPRRLWIARRAQVGRDVAGNATIAAGDPEPSLPWLTDWRLEEPTYAEPAFLETETAIASWICGRDHGQFEPLLETILEARRIAGDVPLAVLLIPDEFQVEDRLWDAVHRRLGDEPLKRDQPQRILRRFLDRHGLPYLDLLPVLRGAALESDGARHVYHLRDTHLNAKGNRLVGEELAAWLRPYLSR
jgi:lysophospholipase L1-like esterase